MEGAFRDKEGRGLTRSLGQQQSTVVGLLGKRYLPSFLSLLPAARDPRIWCRVPTKLTRIGNKLNLGGEEIGSREKYNGMRGRGRALRLWRGEGLLPVDGIVDRVEWVRKVLIAGSFSFQILIFQNFF